MVERDTLNPEALGLGRKSRGLTQGKLAALIGISAARWSRIESGITALRVEDSCVSRICEVLDYPVRFFHRDVGFRSPAKDGVFHRKRASVRQGKLDEVYALAEIRRHEIARLLEADPRPFAVPEYPVELFEDNPAKIARSVRADWNLPTGPVFNMTEILEDAGCVVIAHDFGTRGIDGFHFRPGASTPVFHLNSGLPPDRWRWTLAHELGHLVMAQELSEDPKVLEEQANVFAGEFLAPAHEILPSLHGLTYQKLAGLKLIWKISMQALIQKAYHLGTITNGQRMAMFARLNKAGYRTREPETLDPPVEQPTRLFELAKTHMMQLEYSRADLMELLAIKERDFRAYYYDPEDVVLTGDAVETRDDEWRLT